MPIDKDEKWAWVVSALGVLAVLPWEPESDQHKEYLLRYCGNQSSDQHQEYLLCYHGNQSSDQHKEYLLYYRGNQSSDPSIYIKQLTTTLLQFHWYTQIHKMSHFNRSLSLIHPKWRRADTYTHYAHTHRNTHIHTSVILTQIYMHIYVYIIQTETHTETNTHISCTHREAHTHILYTERHRHIHTHYAHTHCSHFDKYIYYI